MAIKIAMIGAGSVDFTRHLMYDILSVPELADTHFALMGAVCNPEEVWQMTDEMLIAQAEWLPQFADEIPAARSFAAGGKRWDARQNPRIPGRGAPACTLRRGDGT